VVLLTYFIKYESWISGAPWFKGLLFTYIHFMDTIHCMITQILPKTSLSVCVCVCVCVKIFILTSRKHWELAWHIEYPKEVAYYIVSSTICLHPKPYFMTRFLLFFPWLYVINSKNFHQEYYSPFSCTLLQR
jgi:hypothetical protein